MLGCVQEQPVSGRLVGKSISHSASIGCEDFLKLKSIIISGYYLARSSQPSCGSPGLFHLSGSLQFHSSDADFNYDVSSGPE